ncbi:MAG: hypothetical protein AAGI23_13925 [Bacteroidota bacterium]
MLRSCVGPYGINCCNTNTVTSMESDPIGNVSKTFFNLFIDISSKMDCMGNTDSPSVRIEILDLQDNILG